MKKIIFSLVIAATLSMVILVGYGSAKEMEYTGSGSARLGRWIHVGEVIEIREDNFTIEKGDWGQYTFFVDELTKFRVRDTEKPGFSELSIGDQVVVLGRSLNDGLKARLVVILPDGFNPQRWFKNRLRGELIELDGEQKIITIITESGEEIFILVDEGTRILGEASAVQDMEIGWKVLVTGRKLEDGSIQAKIIRAVKYPERIRRVGIISEVNEAPGNLIIRTRTDEKLSFLIDEGTKFFDRKGQVEALSDVGNDMVVIVDAKQVNKGAYFARRVFLADPDVFVNFEVKKAGFVTQVEIESFVVESGDGDAVCFQIDEATSYRSRGKIVDGIRDLETGMILLVGGTLGEDGQNIAKLVIVFQAVPDW